MASSTWQLVHTPAAGGTATTYTLAQLHASLVIEFVNWGMDTASLQCGGASPAFDAAAFAYRDEVVILRDGVRFFVGVVTGLGLSAEAEPQSRTYTLSGPSWWLANIPFRWPYWPVKADLDAGERIAYLWLQFAIDSAKGAGAPVEYSGYSAFSIPTPDLRASSTCLEVVQRVARLFPMSAGWWDYTTTPPTFRASLRAGLTQQTVTVGAGISTFGFTPLPSQQLTSVRIGYTYDPGDGTTAVTYDDAGTAPETVGPNRLHVSIECASSTEATEAANLHIADILHASLSPLAWAGTVNLSAEQCAALPEIRPGNSLSVLGGRTEWETMWTSVQTVQWSVSAAAPDLLTINLGAPEHLGPQDYLEFARSGALGGSGGAGNLSPYDPPGPPPPPPGENNTQPGTIDDLNGVGAASPSGDVIDQARGGVWEKVGFAEYTPDTGTADPYVRYRTKTGSGSIVLDGGSLGCDYVWATTGASRYSATTGALVETMHYTIDEVDQGERLSGEYQGAVPSCGSGYFSYHSTRSRTVLTEWMVLSDGSLGGSTSGSHTVTLSDEDTAQDAADRAFSAHTWATIGSNAKRTPESDTPTGMRVETRWGTYALVESVLTYTPLTGLQPWTSYCLRRTARQRPVATDGTASGEWVTLPDMVAPFLSDIDGNGGVEWQYVEAPEGWEIELGAAKLEAY